MARPPNPDAPHRLLEAARRAFAEVGVDAARVQDIAAYAGFSKAAFYLYYDSKEAVFAQVIGQFFARMNAVAHDRLDALTALIASTGPTETTSEDRLDSYAELDHRYRVLGLSAMWEDRDIVGCILEQTTGPRRAVVDQFIEIARTTMLADLREAVAAGYLRRDLDGELVSEMIVGIYLQLGRRMVRLAETPDLVAWAREIDSFVSDGIGRCHPTLQSDKLDATERRDP